MTPSLKKYKKENKGDNYESGNDESGTTNKAHNTERPIADAATAAPVVPQQFLYNSIYFYHPDHLGTSTYLTDAKWYALSVFY